MGTSIKNRQSTFVRWIRPPNLKPILQPQSLKHRKVINISCHKDKVVHHCNRFAMARNMNILTDTRNNRVSVRSERVPTRNYLIQVFTVSIFSFTQSSATSRGSSLSRPIFRIQPFTTAGSSAIWLKNLATGGLRSSSDLEYAT